MSKSRYRQAVALLDAPREDRAWRVDKILQLAACRTVLFRAADEIEALTSERPAYIDRVLEAPGMLATGAAISVGKVTGIDPLQAQAQANADRIRRIPFKPSPLCSRCNGPWHGYAWPTPMQCHQAFAAMTGGA